jgi:hypothetical protein
MQAKKAALGGTLRPVVAQWDRLSRHWCYMMILAGPVRVALWLARSNCRAATMWCPLSLASCTHICSRRWA